MAELTQKPRAVFLSYAHEDGDVAGRIAKSLQAAGVEVWFDKNELRGGDAWDASIRRKIRECTLFVPVISSNTDARGEGYFRLEWRLAVERSHLMAEDCTFVLPVVIDQTPETTARVPDLFRERQWSRILGGEAHAEFTACVVRLLSGGMAAPQCDRAPPPSDPLEDPVRIAREQLPLGNLPSAVDSFIARELELAEIMASLSQSRLF